MMYSKMSGNETGWVVYEYAKEEERNSPGLDQQGLGISIQNIFCKNQGVKRIGCPRTPILTTLLSDSTYPQEWSQKSRNIVSKWT